MHVPAGTRWVDERYPLLRQEPRSHPPQPTGNRPDIVLLVVESLRACDVGVFSGRTPSITPNIDA